ncbi:MAG: hypothetical protein GTO51_02825 [Candidatus Latescibacteria bacterium]|nr:hypothetical protein [Candidatus Latescibacterota bacterium]NIM22617.1 hypothetical protein [Candidatus Latescibacterota bacterium]NIM64906.1 hypothetical protein [Candidatus Latescibacterota bacterium]NIO01421.1 hypothetical protein [Candidatus Latescibacterota bacterium]NIO27931.1 hypothetical protein [Candidatus Latescibacterota bacterium]
MNPRAASFVTAISCFVFLTSCNDRKLLYKPPAPVEPTCPELKEKDDVFPYLVKVVEERNYECFTRIIDDDFFFKFGVDDVGDDIPEGWGREEELKSAKNMFSGYPHPVYGAVTNISLWLTPEGPWIEVPKTEPPYEGETWYQRTVEYTFIALTSNDWTLQCLELRALFYIRYAEVDGDSIWRIVEWRDNI